MVQLEEQVPHSCQSAALKWFHLHHESYLKKKNLHQMHIIYKQRIKKSFLEANPVYTSVDLRM